MLRILASRSWLVLVATVVIVLLLPHGGVPQFEYELNHPWPYDQLIAKSETPLYKSEEVLQRERDSILSSFEPYYNITVTPREKALKKFKERYGEGIPGIPKAYSSYVARRIRQAYDMGIIGPYMAQKALRDSTLSIRIVSGNTATSVLVKNLLTTTLSCKPTGHNYSSATSTRCSSLTSFMMRCALTWSRMTS